MMMVGSRKEGKGSDSSKGKEGNLGTPTARAVLGNVGGGKKGELRRTVGGLTGGLASSRVTPGYSMQLRERTNADEMGRNTGSGNGNPGDDDG
ncbi:hypothetical protein CVT25_007600 [Psilocybe cyanescens]|uniref:Uncharacterized protein n=1 Tax=Psilocybe cyanescens TaxID=93625 RepID=A0A409VQ01_PSICY|nr:hypothetical protein CVT25_007600 [Psilocybe cyanescens]